VGGATVAWRLVFAAKPETNGHCFCVSFVVIIDHTVVFQPALFKAAPRSLLAGERHAGGNEKKKVARWRKLESSWRSCR